MFKNPLDHHTLESSFSGDLRPTGRWASLDFVGFGPRRIRRTDSGRRACAMSFTTASRMRRRHRVG